MRQAKANSRKFIAIFTAFCMLLTVMPMSVAAAEADRSETAANPPAFQDVAGHWGQTAIEKWSGYDIVNGYNGMFRPDDSITRGEMAVILDNLMDYQVAAENKFSDLKAGQFYTEAILKANAAGIIKGDGATVRPLDKITREESAVMLSRAFAVAESGSAMSFADASAVSVWAKGAVAAMESKGYVSGYAGKFDPKANITRAAAVTMINNIVKAYYTKAGIYTDNVDGTAIIKVSNVILKGVTISGNLIIAEGVGKGDATLDNVTLKGETVVRGGGENSVHIIGNSSISSVRIEKIGEKLRIVVADGASVREVEVAIGEEIIITGTVGKLEVNAAGAVVYATVAEITTATVNGDNSTIVVGAQSTINSLVISSTADNTAIKTEKGSTIKSVEAAATVAVTGTGNVSVVTLKSGADGSSVTTPRTSIPVAEGVTGVTGTGGTALPAGSSGANGISATAPATVGRSNPPASSSGGGGGDRSTIAVSSIIITDMTDPDGVTSFSAVKGSELQMNVAVAPNTATNKLVTWSVSTLEGGLATIDATGVLKGTSAGSVIVRATATDGSGVTGTLEVMIVDCDLKLKGEHEGVAELSNEYTKIVLAPGNVTVGQLLAAVETVDPEASFCIVSDSYEESAITDPAITLESPMKLAVTNLTWTTYYNIVIGVSDISVTSSALTIATPGGTLQMFADVQPTNATNKDVIWDVLDGESDEGTYSAEITQTGLLTALANGSVRVIATSISTGAVRGTLVITISNQLNGGE